MNKNIYKILLLLLLIPINIYAIPSKVIPGGETIGIEVHSRGLYVVGFYNVDGKMIAREAGFKVGDIIREINNKEVSDVESINSIIKETGNYTFKVERRNTTKNIDLYLKSVDNTIKTGLYVKDKINGIGTLSYIDPDTHMFASLGHEIIESNTMSKFNISSGSIYKAEVTTIRKSEETSPGEKMANIYYDNKIGDIYKNEIDGIYGKYNNISNDNTIDVGKKEEIREGPAVIRTVISNNTKEDFSINILSINNSDPIKNIFFEITDKKLLNKTNGIIQGMSGSPIIQNNKIIGVVNYVVLDDTKKGYGIFIETMLKESEKLS